MSKLGREPREFTARLARRDTDTVSLQPKGVLRGTMRGWEVEWSLQAPAAREDFMGHSGPRRGCR